MKNKSFLIYGISQGLGRAIAHNIPHDNDIVYGVSRSKPKDAKENMHWIQADLSQPETAITIIDNTIENRLIDCLIYNVGIWEKEAFSEDYDFENCTDDEIIRMIQTNITSCLLTLKHTLKNLRLSSNAKIILIGSTWGLDNHNGKEVAFSACKYAMRGMVQSLRETTKEDNIGITVLNLGYLATEYDYTIPSDIVIEETKGTLIPIQDVLHAISFILNTSNASCVKEITMPAMHDHNV